MLASALGLPDIVARLLTAGADVHAGDAQQLGPLHCAALYGFSARDRSRLLALLDTLLLAGAEPTRPPLVLSRRCCCCWARAPSRVPPATSRW